MVLVDSSVWIEMFRKGRRFQIESLVALDEVVTCLPVIQEVLQGFREESAYQVAHEAMFSFPVLESPLGAGVFEEAIDLYRSARRSGWTIRSSIDCLIAACALRHRFTVLHKDRDYDLLARVSPLKSRRI